MRDAFANHGESLIGTLRHCNQNDGIYASVIVGFVRP